MVDKRKSPRKFDEEFKKSIVKLYELIYYANKDIKN